MTTVPFVISTGAQRSGEICGFYSPSIWLRTITTLPLVIPTGAQRSGGTCDFYSPAIWLRIITTVPFVISTGAQRSGEISVWMLFPGNVFDRAEGVSFLEPPFP